MDHHLDNGDILVNEPTIPFESDDEAYDHFWQFVLKNVDRFDDKETIDGLHRCYFAWRFRSRNKREKQPMEVGDEDLI